MNIYPFLGIEDRTNTEFISETLSKCTFNFGEKLSENLLVLIEKTVKVKFLPIIELERKIAHAAELVETDEEFVLNVSRSEEWKEYFFESYPDLKDYLDSEYEKLRTLIGDILTRFDKDKNELDLNNATLIDIEIGEGDFHNGQCTCCLIFEHENRLFYKPKSLEGDIKTIRFFLEQQQTMGLDIFYPVKNKSFGNYGWSYIVELGECATLSDVENYYKGLGVLTAFSHALRIEDLIYDNVLCAKGKVALIDLECMLGTSYTLENSILFHAKTGAGELFRKSVILTGLIPRHTYGGKANDGESDGAMSYIPERTVSEKNFKTISEDGKETFIAPELHIPVLDGKHQEPKHFLSEYREGFTQAYKHIVANKEAFSEFARSLVGIESRILWRPTKVYGTLLTESFHVDYLSKVDAREKLFEMMHNGKTGGVPEEVVLSEIRQLLDNDIPAFKKKIGLNDVQDFSGASLNIPYYKETDLEQTLERIESMGEDDFQLQMKTINGAMKIFLDDEAGDVDLRFNPLDENQDTPTLVNSFVHDLAGFLRDQLLVKEENVSLFDISTNVNNGWRFGPIGPGLANGTDSIALFLLSHGVLNNDQESLEKADHIFECNKDLFHGYITDPNFYESHDYFVFSPLQFPGCLLYFAAISDELRPERKLLEDEQLLTDIESYYFNWIEKDNYFDYLIGACGAVIMFYQLYEKTKNERFKRLALVCAEKVATSAKVEGDIACWVVEKFQALGGFSHGTSSYCVAMLMAHKLTGEASYFDLFERSLVHDRSYYDEEQKGYHDNRYYPHKVCSYSWAHGSGGIGLSRVLIKQLLPNYSGIQEEIEVCRDGIAATMDDSEHYSVNGGFAGVIELLAVFNKELGSSNESIDSKWRERVLNWSKNPQLLVSEKSHLHLLMNQGLSGLGYAALRYLHRDKLPSYLYLGVDVKSGPESFYNT